MKTIFVCLANSKKYGERCLAGIELRKGENQELLLVQEGDQPKWIRPVSGKEYGEVAAHLVEHIQLNDLVEIDVLEACPNGYQSENVLFDRHSIDVIGHITPSSENLDKLAVQQYDLFGNTGKAVSQEKITEIHNSLILIKAVNPEVYVRSYSEKEQLRMRFNYGQKYSLFEYDLPITDLTFIDQYFNNQKILDKAKDIYLTISLGVLYEGWHYKLVAGVIHI